MRKILDLFRNPGRYRKLWAFLAITAAMTVMRAAGVEIWGIESLWLDALTGLLGITAGGYSVYQVANDPMPADEAFTGGEV